MRFGPGEAPAGLLAALRDIDPDADLIHMGGDEWILGVRRANPAASKRLQEELQHLDPLRMESGEATKEFRFLQFCASEPFRPIHLYTAERPGPDIVEDFRIRDHNWRTRPAEAIAEMKEEISIDVRDERRNATIREWVEGEGPSLFRHVFKRARSFVQGALPGSR